MRRSICFCEPNHALAGEINTWKYTYTTAAALPKGTLIRFDMLSNARPIDWEVPTVDLKKKQNVLFARLEDNTILAAKEISFANRFTPQYEFVLPKDIEVGGSFTIVVGSPDPDPKTRRSHGNRAQSHAQRRRPFHLYIDTTKKGKFDEPEIFNMDVRGNALKHIKIITPSFTGRNKRFDVTIRFEDSFGNLTSHAPEETLIELSYENIRDNLNWKLFIPETGFLTLPNLYFNEAGCYTIKLTNMDTKEVFTSSPIICFPENTKNLFWGLLHGETEKFDSSDNIENCLCHLRDEKSLNFFASSPFDTAAETSNESWKQISQHIDDYNESERFVTLLGFQWEGEPGTEGLRHMIYQKDQKPLMRSKDAKYSNLKKIYKSLTPKELISIPSLTMGKGHHFNFKDFDPAFERVVEIYNAWGSSEMTKKEGNPWPITGTSKQCIAEALEGSLINALKNNCRFGFVAGGLDDRGVYANCFQDGQEQYWPGLTGIVAKDLTRSSLYEALYHRSCFATTGERMIVGISIAGVLMGSECTTAQKPGLLYNRHISGYALGTTDLSKIEIIRNGVVIHTIEPKNTYHHEFTYDDLQPLEKVALNLKDGRPLFAFYYLRITQQDGHMAWSSPIWIDIVEEQKEAAPSDDDE